MTPSLVPPQMQCRFVVYSVPWEKRKDLVSHECVGLEETIMSCERSNPVEAKSEPDQNNMVKEILLEPVKVHVHVDERTNLWTLALKDDFEIHRALKYFYEHNLSWKLIVKQMNKLQLLSIDHFQNIKIQLGREALMTQTKEIEWLYWFLLFLSSKF